MTTTQSDDDNPAPQDLLKPTRYERAGSWLIALLFLTTVANIGLVIVWYGGFDFGQASDTSKMPPNIYEVSLTPTAAERAMAVPTVGELTDLTLESTLTEDVLQRITDNAPGIAVSVPVDGTEFPDNGDSDWTGDDDGGDSRPPGGPDVIPPWERWELKFDSTSQKRYAQQLDYFKIELAAIGGRPLVDYASDLSKGKPKTRRGESRDEERIYMTWKNGNLLRFDKQLLRAAGIPFENRIIMRFLNAELVETLTKLEDAHTDRPPEEWQKTVFSLHQKGDQYEWRVSEQTYRK